jgi:phosphate transport system substrate-binding protein
VKRTMRNRLIATTAVGGLALAAAVPAMASLGGGASFPNLAYSAWCANSHLCSYSSVGSGAGITGFQNGTYDWSASDAPLASSDIATLQSKQPGQGVKYQATLLGGIAVPTHINGVNKTLKLTGGTLAGIFDGSITKWNAKSIANTNPGVRLPNATIIECVRQDSSGTSYNFSNFLGKNSSTFLRSVGVSKTPNWSGTIQKGLKNPGVAACVQSNNNSIGYVDLGDGINAGLKNFSKVGHTTKVKVHGKYKTVVQFVAPGAASIQAAGNSSKLNVTNATALQLALLSSSNPNAYPITITTFVLAYAHYNNPGLSNGAGKLTATKQFLNYAYGPGQNQLAQFHFVKLPAALLKLEKKQLAGLK